MASDFNKVLQEIRGTGAPEEEYTDGIYWDLTIALHNGNPGVYGDILDIYANILLINNDYDQFAIEYADFLAKYSDFLVKYADVLVIYDDIQVIQTAVEQSAQDAQDSADSILTLTTTSQQVPTEDPVEVGYDANTGNMHFKIPAGKEATVEVTSTSTLAPGSSATVVDQNPSDTNDSQLAFGIPEGLKGDNFIILGQKTVAEVALLSPTKGAAWQVTDSGSIGGTVFNAFELAYGDDFNWLNIGGIGSSAGFQVRGSITLVAGTDTGTIHDENFGDHAVDSTGFVGANPGIPNSAVYTIDADTLNNSITGASVSYTTGETLTYLDGAANPWFKISASVSSFNGRNGDVVPEAGDYDKVLVGLGQVDNTSDLAKPVSTATQVALSLKVSKTSNIGSAQMPTGDTSERDVSPDPGSFRFNDERNQFEGYNNTEWGAVGGTPDATGLAGYELGTNGTSVGDASWSPIRTNPNVLVEDYTLTDGVSGSVVSGFQIADTIELTIPDGSALSLV